MTVDHVSQVRDEDAVPAERPAAARTGNFVRQLLILLAVYGCYRYLLSLSQTYFLESDNASIMLAARDILRGNLVLRGWWLPSDTFWLTEMPFYAAGLAFRGFAPILMNEVPTALYLGLLVIAAVAVLSPFEYGTAVRTRIGMIALLAGLVPLLFPSDVLGAFALRGPYRIANISVVLCAFLLMQYARLRGSGHRSTRPLVASAALLAAAMVSDPMTLWFGIAPAILASGVLIWRNPARWRGPAIVPASVAITGWLAAKIVLAIIRFFHGFTPVGQVASFVDFSHLGTNISLFIQGILELFGANFFGLAASAGTLPVLLRLLGCLAVMAAIAWTWRDAREHDDLLSLLLASATILIIAAFVFSGIPHNPAAARYLIPLVVFGCVLLGRGARRIQIPAAPKGRLAVVVLALTIMGLYAVTPIARLRHPAAAVEKLNSADIFWPSVNTLASWLRVKGLSVGYAPYDAASIITVVTRGNVTVRPAWYIAPPDSKLKVRQEGTPSGDEVHAREWYAKCDWYRDPRARFVVARGDWEGGRLNLRTATLVFGRPTAVYTVAEWTVFEWDHPVHPRLTAFRAGRARQWIIRHFMKGIAQSTLLRPFVESPCS